MSPSKLFINLSVVFEVDCNKLLAKMEGSYFYGLPNEMLEKIMKNLEIRDVARWNAAYPDDFRLANLFPWLHVTVKPCDGVLTRNICAVAEEKATSLRLPTYFDGEGYGPNLDLRNTTAMFFTGVNWLSMVSLELGCIFQGMGTQLPRSLRHLSLFCSGSRGLINECEEIAALVNLPQLSHLTIRGYDFLPTETDENLHITAYNFEPLHPLAAKLEVFEIDTYGRERRVRPFQVGGLDLGENCNVKVLKISAHLLLPGVENGRYESIQSLSLGSYCMPRAEIGDDWFGQFPNLTELGVQAAVIIGWQGIPSSLQSLDLELMTVNRQDGFCYDTLPLLRFRDLTFLSVRFNRCHGRTGHKLGPMWYLENEAIQSLRRLSLLENLETLVITGCFDLIAGCTREVFPGWRSSLKNLVIKQECNFFHPWNYTEFSELFGKFPRLETLSFVRKNSDELETMKSLVSAIEFAPNLVMVSFTNYPQRVQRNFQQFQSLLPIEWKSGIIDEMCVAWRVVPRPTTTNLESHRFFLHSDVAFRCNFFAS